MTQAVFRPSISVRDVPMTPSGPNSASIQFDTAVLANLPRVAVICPTGNRGHLWPLMKHNMTKQTYPHHLLHWILVDDGAHDPQLEANVAEFASLWPGTVQLKRLTLPDGQRLILGRKRNVMCELGFEVADICVHMDDDDLYHKESVKVRVTILEMYRKEGIECVGCTQVNCYDVVTDTAFNAFDPCHAGKPSGFSESTVAYYKSFWEERKWPDDARNAEGHAFMLNRWSKAMNIPSSFVICQLTHDSNTIVRRTYNAAPAEGTPNRVSYRESNMTPDERETVDVIHNELLNRSPQEKAAKVFLDIAGKMAAEANHKDRLLDIYFRTQWGIESAHRFKVFRRAHISLDHFSHIESRVPDAPHAGLRIAYVCPPSSNPLAWNAFERCANWGGSEEAVKHITRYFVNQLGARVVVFSQWSKELIDASGPISDLRQFGRVDPETGVYWKPYDLWNAMDEADLTIVWRDPGGLEGFRDPAAHRAGKTCLDVHDQLQVYVPSALNPVDMIMVKSEHHRNTCIPAEHHHKCVVIPNGFDPYLLNDTPVPDEFVRELPAQKKPDERKYLFINTSRPDRGLTCLMDTVREFTQPRKKTLKQKKSAWAYGFQDMPADLVAKWQARRDSLPQLDILEKISEKAVCNLYNDGKYFLYASRFIETDCISLTKAMFYGSFPLVTRVGAVGEKIQKYIDWLDAKGEAYAEVRRPVLYDIPADRLVPDGYGPASERHPNDSSSGLYDTDHTPSKFAEYLEAQTALPVTPRDQAAMREFALEHFTWSSVADAWKDSTFGKVAELQRERRLIKACNEILADLQSINPVVQKIVLDRRIVLLNPAWESDEERDAAKVILSNHKKVAHVLHTANVKTLEAFINMQFLNASVVGFERPEYNKVIVVQGCGLYELARRLRDNRDLLVVEL